MLGRTTGLFKDVSQVCTAMSHHCIVGGSKGITNVKNYQYICGGEQPTYWLIPMQLIWEHLWSTWLPCSHYTNSCMLHIQNNIVY